MQIFRVEGYNKISTKIASINEILTEITQNQYNLIDSRLCWRWILILSKTINFQIYFGWNENEKKKQNI